MSPVQFAAGAIEQRGGSDFSFLTQSMQDV